MKNSDIYCNDKYIFSTEILISRANFWRQRWLDEKCDKMVYTIRWNQGHCNSNSWILWLATMSLFGSYAKGNAASDSDIDFIIKKGDLVGIKYFSLLEELEDGLNCKIHLITTGFSNKEFLNRIKEDRVLIYEHWTFIPICMEVWNQDLFKTRICEYVH